MTTQNVFLARLYNTRLATGVPRSPAAFSLHDVSDSAQAHSQERHPPEMPWACAAQAWCICLAMLVHLAPHTAPGWVPFRLQSRPYLTAGSVHPTTHAYSMNMLSSGSLIQGPAVFRLSDSTCQSCCMLRATALLQPSLPQIKATGPEAWPKEGK